MKQHALFWSSGVLLGRLLRLRSQQRETFEPGQHHYLNQAALFVARVA
jgi:hypothetical protein